MSLHFRFLVRTLVAASAALALFLPAAADAPVPNHVPTWAHDGPNGGQTDPGTTSTSTNPTSQRDIWTWLSYAETGTIGRPTKAYFDCHAAGSPCKLVIYYDPGRVYSACPGGIDKKFVTQNTGEDFYLHDSASVSPSNRTTGSQAKWCNGSPILYPNWYNPAVGQWYARTLLWQFPENPNTMMFQDDSSAECLGRFRKGENFVPYELQGKGNCEQSIVMGLRTVADQMRWQDGMRVPVIANGFALHHYQRMANDASIALAAPGSNIVGGLSERQITRGTTYEPRGVFADVNTASLAYALNSDALYVLLGNTKAAVGSTQPCSDSPHNLEDGCGALQMRRNLLAAFWLAYKEEHTVLFETGIRDDPHLLSVFPEASIYPSNPIQALKPFNSNVRTTNGSGCGPSPGSGGIQSFAVACGTLNDGKTPAGVYVREFRECYNFGQLIGAGWCALVANTTNRAVTADGTWFTKGYTHTMVVGSGPQNGADVLTAGCGDGRCPKSAIDPLGAPFVAGETKVPAFDALFLFHS